MERERILGNDVHVTGGVFLEDLRTLYGTMGLPECHQYTHQHVSNSLVVKCWLRVREVPGSIPSQGPRHTKDVTKNGTIISP